MNEIIGIIPHKFRRRGFGVACTLLLRAGLNFLGLAVLLPVLALALDARSLDGGGSWPASTRRWASRRRAVSR